MFRLCSYALCVFFYVDKINEFCCSTVWLPRVAHPAQISDLVRFCYPMIISEKWYSKFLYLFQIFIFFN